MPNWWSKRRTKVSNIIIDVYRCKSSRRCTMMLVSKGFAERTETQKSSFRFTSFRLSTFNLTQVVKMNTARERKRNYANYILHRVICEIIILRSANFSKMWIDLTANRCFLSTALFLVAAAALHRTLSNSFNVHLCGHTVHSFPQHHHQTCIHRLPKEDNEREWERETSQRKMKISFFRLSCLLFFHVQSPLFVCPVTLLWHASCMCTKKISLYLVLHVQCACV